MAISDTITSMYENVGNVYDILELAGADLTNVDKNIENLKQSWEERLLYFLANGTDVVWNNWLPKVNGTGESITINNTIQAKMDFVYKGNTSQESTTGKNLYNSIDRSQTRYNITCSIQNNKITLNGTTTSLYDNQTYFNVNGTENASGNYPEFDSKTSGINLKSGTYTISLSNKNGTTTNANLRLVVTDVYKGTYPNTTLASFTFNDNYKTFTLSEDTTIRIKVQVIRIDTSISEVALNNYSFNLQLETGSTATSYEPYTNGPAPNPDYPYPVNVVTKNNSIQVSDYKNSVILPSGYTQVDYIESSGTQYIDTGYTPVQGDNFELKNVSSYSGTLISAGTGTYQLILLHIGNTVYYRFLSVTPAVELSSYPANSNIKLDNGDIYVNETLKATATYGGAVDTQLYIGRRANYTAYYQGKIGEIIISNNSIIKKHYVPCYRNNDNVVGMYELISNTFLTNAGTGTFTYGRVITTQTYPINLGSMELCKIGDYQDYVAKSTGKNLFDANNYNLITVYFDGNILRGESANKSIYIPCEKNTTYTISKMPSKRFGVAYTTEIPANNVSIYGRIFNHDGNSITITTGNDAVYLTVWLLNGNMSGEITLEQAINTLQIELGSSATSYEPYGKVWYKYGAIGKVVLDGGEDEGWTFYNRNENRTAAFITLSDIKAYLELEAYLPPKVLSNYFNAASQNATWLAGNVSMRYQDSGRVYFCFDTSYTDIASIKEWISTHNIGLYYVLATPTITPITDTTLIEQLEAIKLSYNEQTNISQTNTDKPFVLDVTALKDLNVEDTIPTLTTNRGLLFTQPPVSENFINDEDDNSILEEIINEEEPNIEDDNREEEESVDFFEKEIINNDEEQEEIPTEPIEIDNGQR